MRGFIGGLMAVAVFAAPALAQNDQTLADIRQELTVLHVEVQKLNRELSTTGGVGVVTAGGTTLDRVNAIENELQRLTAKTEELEFRINQVVRDGTKRIGDLEFRLVELEGGDVSKLGETSTLGGGAAPVVAVAASPAQSSELAVGEQADFELAEKSLAAGDHSAAATQFASFNETYPNSPLAAKAFLGRGQALEGSGDQTGAARAYLDAFKVDPTGAEAPEALFHLGRGLGRLGQTSEACVTLGEVGARFPGGAAETKAHEEMARLGCS